MTDTLYPSALLENGQLVDAGSLTKEKRKAHDYYCPCCGGKMTPVLGRNRIKHFRHLGTVCKRNDYLHGCAEAVFMEEYQKCLDKGLPFYIERPFLLKCNQCCVLSEHDNCKEREVRRLVDLTRDYTIISKEERVFTDKESYRRPDILLKSEDGKKQLWVEFCVTHEVDEQKRKLGEIIEIKINSQEDIEIFRQHRLVQSDNKDRWIRLSMPLVRLDEPIEKTPPCMHYFLYEVHPKEVYGYSRITDHIPSDTENITYRISLILNWQKGYNETGCSMGKFSRTNLDEWCRARFREEQQDDDIRFQYLVVDEYRSPRMPTSHLHRQSKPPKKGNNNDIIEPVKALVHVNWIDLGLPSGLLWADVNGAPECIDDFGELPSKNQIKELQDNCKQEIDEGKLRIVGPNGKSITLNSGQYRLSSGSVDMMSIYPSTGNNFIHLYDDDRSPRHMFRCVRPAIK